MKFNCRTAKLYIVVTDDICYQQKRAPPSAGINQCFWNTPVMSVKTDVNTKWPVYEENTPDKMTNVSFLIFILSSYTQYPETTISLSLFRTEYNLEI
jgi:hypothetical protein